MSSVSPISLWQEVISGEGEAADRRELGILQSVLFELLIFVFRRTPRPSSLYQTVHLTCTHGTWIFLYFKGYLVFI